MGLVKLTVLNYYLALKLINNGDRTMTIEEFNKTGFTGKMKMKYQGEVYDVISVDFEESLFAYSLDGDYDHLSWARCENVELI